ncbi:MAG: restriction endonuclease subunit M [Clostridiaceae bacterium]|nr:restriction endonuclease subunit M [Clostridiaceae bacterium]
MKSNTYNELYLCDSNKNIYDNKTKLDLRIKQNTDIKENILLKTDKKILEILLLDRTTNENLLWASDTYKKYGNGYEEDSHMVLELITGKNGNIIKPRVKKNKEEQSTRIRDKAEVFTPSWICNAQNNLIDTAWLGYENAFNTETEKGWNTSTKKIKFSKSNKKTWKDYILANRLEISCGEAPYLTSRYDTVTGNFIEIKDRIGLLDRKLRVISEKTKTEDSWIEWAKEATKSIYGYDFQGDNVFLARENILFAVIEYFENQFDKQLDKNIILELAEIISWNIWQMDGLTYSIPYAAVHKNQLSLFGNNEKSKVCLIKDWKNDKAIEFISLSKRSV